MFVLDVSLQVYLLPEAQPTDVTLVLPDVLVDAHVTLQVAAGASFIVTYVADVGLAT